MSKDKDLESIKNGNGLKNSDTSNKGTNTKGITTEQRGQVRGIRLDIYSDQSSKIKDNK